MGNLEYPEETGKMAKRVFVFASNLAGNHAAGSAAEAVKSHGAKMLCEVFFKAPWWSALQEQAKLNTELCTDKSDAQIGSSGDYAQIGSSGYSAKIEALGEKSAVADAGVGGTARAGKDGAICLRYTDSEDRPRFAVGYVGEDGIKAEVWYKADPKTGKLVKA
jgi:hypothetical protein